jgi:hypothetical protein
MGWAPRKDIETESFCEGDITPFGSRQGGVEARLKLLATSGSPVPCQAPSLVDM